MLFVNFTIIHTTYAILLLFTLKFILNPTVAFKILEIQNSPCRPRPRSPGSTESRRSFINMVEGHSVHRVANLHRKRLVGKSFFAWSPNGRFTEGADLINGKMFSRIEAVGKNLFCFFDTTSTNTTTTGNINNNDNNNNNNNNSECVGEVKDEKQNNNSTVVVHVHFGMAGNWAVYQNEDAPEPSKTNRLRLEYPGIVADLSAMTVQYGGIEDLYEKKRSKLGEDPLRDDSNPEQLWSRVQKSKKSIGALIMDQSYFTGPGNIYRAEILFKAKIHPDRIGKTLTRQEFDMVWYHTKDLLKRGYITGSILTVDSDEAKALGKPNMRRYIYNTSKCPRCSSSIKSWQIAARTCYACPKCQPLSSSNHTSLHTTLNMDEEGKTKISSSSSSMAAVVSPQRNDVVPFNSHCARESVSTRLLESGPSRLTVKELKVKLREQNVKFPSNAKKSILVGLLLLLSKAEVKMKREEEEIKGYDGKTLQFISSENAAAEKAEAGESLAVEHIAELAPRQARKARSKFVSKTSISTCTTKVKSEAVVDDDNDNDIDNDKNNASCKNKKNSVRVVKAATARRSKRFKKN